VFKLDCSFDLVGCGGSGLIAGGAIAGGYEIPFPTLGDLANFLDINHEKNKARKNRDNTKSNTIARNKVKMYCAKKH
jgi:hypothetical protein